MKGIIDEWAEDATFIVDKVDLNDLKQRIEKVTEERIKTLGKLNDRWTRGFLEGVLWTKKALLEGLNEYE